MHKQLQRCLHLDIQIQATLTNSSMLTHSHTLQKAGHRNSPTPHLQPNN